MLKPIATWIAANTSLAMAEDGAGTLQVGARAPGAPARCTVLLERSGGVTDFYLTDRVDYALQVLSRAPDYLTARDDAWEVYEFLHGQAGVTLPVVESGSDDWELLTAEAQATPASIGQDELHRHEFSTNYILRLKRAREY